MLEWRQRHKLPRLMGWGDARRARIEARQARKEARIAGRTERAKARQETTQVMAEQGMRRGQVVGDLLSKGLDIAGRKIAPEQQKQPPAGKSLLGGDSGSGGLGMLLPLAAIGFLAMKKK